MNSKMKTIQNYVISVIMGHAILKNLKAFTRTSDTVSFSFSFTYDCVENILSSNRPYRPSLSHVADRPSLGGVYCTGIPVQGKCKNSAPGYGDSSTLCRLLTPPLSKTKIDH